MADIRDVAAATVRVCSQALIIVSKGPVSNSLESLILVRWYCSLHPAIFNHQTLAEC